MVDISGAAAQQLAAMLTESRSQVLTRYAGMAEDSARLMRDQKTRFPDRADGLEALAVACDVYAAECRAAAADHTLPTPSGPHYPPKGDHRG